MNKRTKALSIPVQVKRAVANRDSIDGWPCCIYCGRPAPVQNTLAYSNAHFIGRAQGGLGIERNILTLCPQCHREFDQSPERAYMQEQFRVYLRIQYPDWDERQLTYAKGG